MPIKEEEPRTVRCALYTPARGQCILAMGHEHFAGHAFDEDMTSSQYVEDMHSRKEEVKS